MSTVGNVSINTSTPPATSTSSNPSQTLTQQDFLKIMVAQFTQQDPLSSGGGGGDSSGTSDYVNQLMSMTNLTTMQTMSSQLATSTQQQALNFAQSVTGTSVEVADAKGNVVDGVVSKASLDTTTGDVLMTINGQQYSSANIISFDQTVAAAGTTTASTTTN